MDTNFFEICSQLFQKKMAFVVVTLVSGRGYTPQDPGAKAIVTEQGLHWGTVGGGKVEARAILFAQQKISVLAESGSTAPQLITWNLQRDIGMTCGGEVTYLFELHSLQSWKIAVFGAGHVAQALVRTLITLNCSVTCVDARPEWIEKLPNSPKLTALQNPNPVELVLSMPQDTFFVVMTQGHATDVPVLRQIFESHANAPYVGAIGSSLKGTKIKTELKTLGVAAELLNRLRCPIGLNLGKNDPAEIALSIAAELLQVRDQARPYLASEANKAPPQANATPANLAQETVLCS